MGVTSPGVYVAVWLSDVLLEQLSRIIDLVWSRAHYSRLRLEAGVGYVSKENLPYIPEFVDLSASPVDAFELSDSPVNEM